MFVVATATFRILYALIVLGHDRRKVIHFEVTRNPTQVWLSRQMTEAFPWETAPRYLLRDRDTSYGPAFRARVKAMSIEEVLTASRSPWQNPFVERLIGSIRRECLDHIIIFNERHWRRILSRYPVPRLGGGESLIQLKISNMGSRRRRERLTLLHDVCDQNP
jgi:putative transposase